MKQNQIVPVLSAAGQQHPQGLSLPWPSSILHHTHKPGLSQASPQSHPVSPLLPWVRACHHSPAQPAVMPTSARCRLWTISPGLILAVQLPSSLKSLSRVHFPQCQPPQLTRLGLPAFQTDFSIIERLQPLGCSPFHEEVISEHLLGPQLKRSDGKRARAGRGFGNSFLPSSLQVCPH